MATGENPADDQRLAEEYLSDRVYDALLEMGEAAKVSEITLEINNPRIQVPVVRRTLTTSLRFVVVERLYNIVSRYQDKSRSADRTVREVLQAAGHPLSLSQIATELSAIYERPSDIYLQLLGKTLKNEKTYFRTQGNEYGLITWLPLTDADDLKDVLFDNKLKASDLAPLEEASRAADWKKGYADATYALVEASKGTPLPHRLIGVLAWKVLQTAYDPSKHIIASLKDSRLVWLNGRWITRVHADKLEDLLEQEAQTLAEAAEEMPIVVETAPIIDISVNVGDADEPAPALPVEPAKPVAPPLNITGDDIRMMDQIVIERGGAVDVVELLALQYEVVPGDASFRADVETLTHRLKSDSHFLSVGAGRFREPNSLPLFIYTIPESLSYPDFQFVSMDGEIMDEEISEDGFAGSLRGDLQSPLAQDVGDDEGKYTGSGTNGDSIRLVVKAHHKEIGTFPLCQVPDGFFPSDTEVVELIVRDAENNVHDIIVNHKIRMAFNLFGLYEAITADSGGVFLLHRTNRPYEFRFEPLAETDSQIYLETARYEELVGLREQADESGDVATFDIACEVLAHHAKGLDFVQMMTEVNVVRRVTRRKLASILSNYHCFVQKPGQPLWRFDAKKREMGTDRDKRKYIQR